MFCTEMGKVRRGGKLPFILLVTTNIILNGERLKAFHVRSEMRQGCLHFTTAIQHCTVSSRQNKRQGGQIKQTAKERSKVLLSLFEGDMILYIFFKSPKIHMKAIRANKFSKVAGMKLTHG